MGLPYVIEYLLSLERPGGSGRLVAQGASQTIIPQFPPNTSVTLTAYPYLNDWGYIPFYSALSPGMVPGAFSGWGQYWGARQYTGILGSWFVMPGSLDSFLLVTQDQPALAQITNLTAVNQYYEGISMFLVISDEEDWQLIRRALKRINQEEAIYAPPPLREGS